MNSPVQSIWYSKSRLTALSALLAGLGLAIVAYILLPLIGISTFANLITPKKLIMLSVAAAGMIGYFQYLIWITKRPDILVMFVLWAWAIVECVDQWLLNTVGLNLHMRPLLIMTFVFPALFMLYQYFPKLWKELPLFKYILVFLTWMFLYVVFYNNHTADPNQISGTLLETMDAAYAIAYLHGFICIVVAAVAYWQNPEPNKMFDKLNRGLLIISSLAAIVSVIGYPLNIWTLNVDGFTRSIGLFSQPNPFAHHTAILLLYFVGLLGYYTHQSEKRISRLLIVSAIVCNFAALGLSLSKTAIGIVALCVGLWLVLNMPSPAVRRNCIKWFPFAVIGLSLAIFAVQIALDRSFFELFESRMNDSESLNWRQQVWQGLIGNMDSMAYLIGRGFTSANEWVFQLTYNNRLNTKPLILVHNGYINLIYDMGIMGWTLFAGVVAMIWSAVQRLWLKPKESTRFLITTVIAMGVYYLVVSGMDEMTYMFDAALLFWTLTTLLCCKALPRSAESKQS